MTRIIGDSVEVTGAVDLDSTLNVDGAATLQTTLHVIGATDLDSTLNVDGATTLNPTNTTGAGLAVTRNLTAASTDSPVVSIIQDHASDDQDALVVESDGTGSVATFKDGANTVVQIGDGGALNLINTTQLIERLRLSGQEFFAAAHTDTDGPVLLLGVNRSANRQIWFADSALLTQNTTNPVFRLVIQAAGMAMGALATDGATVLPLQVQGAPVGINIASPNASQLGVKAGTSTNDAAVGGVLYQTTTQGANVGAGEDDLASYSVPANTLSANGMSLWFEAWGTLANNTNSKVIRVRFTAGSGTTQVFAANAVTTAAGGFAWTLRGRVIRTGAATQKAHATIVYGAATVVPQAGSTTALDQTLSGAVTLKVTGEAVSNSDILLEGFIVGYDDANT